MSGSFLWSFHYFRAFAILNILILHLWVLPSKSIALVHYQVIFKELIFHSSTLYFLFISGFLVMHLKERIATKSYYKSKLKNVLLPYLLISIALFFVYAFLGSQSETVTLDLWGRLGKELLLGKVNFHFWYIPFILPIFAITPLLLKIPNRFWHLIGGIALLIPLFGTRTGTTLSLGQYLYFFPVYLLGMYLKIYWHHIKNYLSVNLKYVVLAFFGVAIMLAILLAQHNFQESYPFYIESLFYLKRLLVTLFILFNLESVKVNKYPLMDVIAKYSFALYFIHGSIGIFLQPILFRVLSKIDTVLWIPITLLYTTFLIFFCMVLIWGVKRVFGDKSRILIGY